jgi:hypothetical protein
MAPCLVAVLPLDRGIARTREGLRGTFTLMAVISGALLGLSILVLVVGNRRRGPWPSGRHPGGADGGCV